MKIKDCLACQMDQQRIAEFITELAINSSGDSYNHAWRSKWEEAEDDPEARQPTFFLTHMYEGHADEVLDLTNAAGLIYYNKMEEAENQMKQITLEVF
jgi:hypothetical protein